MPEFTFYKPPVAQGPNPKVEEHKVPPTPGAAGVHGDPFPERATTVFVPDTSLQQTEVPPNPPRLRAVPKYYEK